MRRKKSLYMDVAQMSLTCMTEKVKDNPIFT